MAVNAERTNVTLGLDANCYTPRKVDGMASAITDVLAARVPKNVAKQVRDRAQHERVSVSEIVAQIIAERFDNQHRIGD